MCWLIRSGLLLLAKRVPWRCIHFVSRCLAQLQATALPTVDATHTAAFCQAVSHEADCSGSTLLTRVREDDVSAAARVAADVERSPLHAK